MKKITLKANGAIEHVWIDGIHNIPEDAIEVSNQTVETLLNHRETKALIAGNIIDIVIEFNFDLAFAVKTNEIRNAFSSAMLPITSTYTSEDIASFPTQESEAKAYEEDPQADTPLLDFMVANRPGVDKPILVSRILANSVVYKQVAGPAIGKKQHFEDLLYALKAQHEDSEQPDVTQADFDAIVVDFS